MFEKAFEFLHNVEEQKERVLVHCAAGANRSATVVIAWLMYSRKLKLQEAWDFAKGARPGICPLKDNRMQLLEYEKKLYGSTSLSAEALQSLR